VKAAALLSGILASAIAWAAAWFVADLSVQFLELWPASVSQQLLGLVIWHGIIALPLVGGILAVVGPVSGGILLVAAAAAWAFVGTALPAGFVPQLLVPLAFSALGAILAFGASIRGAYRRRIERKLEFERERLEREAALRFEPAEDLARAVDLRSRPFETEPPLAAPSLEAIVPVNLDKRRDQPPQGFGGLVLVNALVLPILVIAVGVLFYSDYRTGALANAFGTPPVVSVDATAIVPAQTISAAAPDTSPVVEMPPAPAPPARQEASLMADDAAPPSPAGDMASADATGLEVASLPIDPATLPAEAWSDPFAYCAAVGTVDFPDHRYTGPMVSEAIATALRVPTSSPPDRVKWRCADGAVLACASFRNTPNCAPTPSVREMMDYCAQNPDAVDLAAPNGTWFCNGTDPQIPPDQRWPVDGRGFLPGAWVAIAPPPSEARAAAG
jgi:hypothetical protein